jgi:hypothetical protein
VRAAWSDAATWLLLWAATGPIDAEDAPVRQFARLGVKQQHEVVQYLPPEAQLALVEALSRIKTYEAKMPGLVRQLTPDLRQRASPMVEAIVAHRWDALPEAVLEGMPEQVASLPL